MSNSVGINERIEKSGKIPEQLTYNQMCFDPVRENVTKFEIFVDRCRLKIQLFNHYSNWLVFFYPREKVRKWIIRDYYIWQKERMYAFLYDADRFDEEMRLNNLKYKNRTNLISIPKNKPKIIFSKSDEFPIDIVEYNVVPFPEYNSRIPNWFINLEQRGLL